MAVNSYDQPAQAQFMNTFVPLPFDQILQLGREAQSRIDRSMDQMSSQMQKWSEFQSPSQTDIDRWNDLTFGQMRDTVDQMAANPDFIKTAEGRSKLYGKLNNLQYGKLAQLRQGAKTMEDAQKYEQQLLAAGKWNLDWHGYDYAKHDTLGEGIYREERIPYEDIRSLVTPYVDKIQPGFLGEDGMYDLVGIDQARVKQSLDENLSSIMGTPQAQRHIKSFMDMGMSREDATRQFYNQAYQDAMYKVNIQRTPNPYKQMAFQNQLAMQLAETKAQNDFNRQMAVQGLRNAGRGGGSGSSGGAGPTASLIQTLWESGTTQNNRNVATNQAAFPTVTAVSNRIAELKNAISTEQDADNRDKLVKELEKGYNLLGNSFTKDLGVQYDSFKQQQSAGSNNEQKIANASNYVLGNISSTMSNDASAAIMDALGGNKAERLMANDYIFNTTKGMMSMPVTTSMVIGRSPLSEFGEKSAFTNFNEALSSGKFNDVRVQNANNEFITYSKNGRNVTAVKVRVSIPEQQFKNIVSRGDRTKVMNTLGGRTEQMNVTKSTSPNVSRSLTGPTFVTFDAYREIPSSPEVISNLEHRYNQAVKQTASQSGSNASYIDERAFNTAGVYLNDRDYNFEEE